ncbi:metal-sensitive transcriptional regulator [Candidatus Acetothermia bacterium]|nr:metal-sensitive transcriptional regulator [Candidatus Acetothermia bacterium]
MEARTTLRATTKAPLNARHRSRHGGLCQLPEVKREILQRIRTAEGHLQGIDQMIADARYCIDILKQIAAVQSSVSRIAQLLVKSHMRTCLLEAIDSGQGEQSIEELAEILKYLRAY